MDGEYLIRRVDTGGVVARRDTPKAARNEAIGCAAEFGPVEIVHESGVPLLLVTFDHDD